MTHGEYAGLDRFDIRYFETLASWIRRLGHD
jgi:hypothetical protein